MFGKLMKYEMKSLSKGLIPLYGAILAVALINSIMWSVGGNGPASTSGTIGGLSQLTAMLVYFGLCVAIAVVTFLVVVQRFYKGLLGQEGYLMFTLPVPTWQLTLSKLVGATIMTILSGIVGILSVFILGSVGINWGAFFRDLGQLFANWDLDMTFICIELFLLGIVSTASMVTDIYIAMALGYLSNKHRVAMSFVWFIVIQTALSFLTGLLGIVLGNIPASRSLSPISSLFRPSSACTACCGSAFWYVWLKPSFSTSVRLGCSKTSSIWNKPENTENRPKGRFFHPSVNQKSSSTVVSNTRAISIASLSDGLYRPFSRLPIVSRRTPTSPARSS